MEKKFELTENYVVNEFGTKLYQIKCTKTFEYAKEGEIGGFIEKEENLSQEGNAWVCGTACLKSDADHCGFDCFGSSNRHTHAYLTSDNTVEITCGCFRGSIGEFEKRVKNIHAGTVYENQYNAIINVIKIKFGLDETSK